MNQRTVHNQIWHINMCIRHNLWKFGEVTTIQTWKLTCDVVRHIKTVVQRLSHRIETILWLGSFSRTSKSICSQLSECASNFCGGPCTRYSLDLDSRPYNGFFHAIFCCRRFRIYVCKSDTRRGPGHVLLDAFLHNVGIRTWTDILQFRSDVVPEK